MSPTATEAANAERVAALTRKSFDQAYRRASGAFMPLLVSEWLIAVIASVTWSPLAWGDRIQPNVHIYAAVFGGAALTLLPVFLAINRPTSTATRWAMAVAQMLWSALLIHLSGGHLEAHFAFFISLAFLALYRDWSILIPATAVALAAIGIIGAYWPESLYGTSEPQTGRLVEYGVWLLLADIAAAASCAWGARDLRLGAVRQVDAEVAVEREQQRSRELFAAMKELETTQDALARAGKLAVAGQLATTLGNELQIPLAAIATAQTALSTALQQSGVRADLRIDDLCVAADRQLETCVRVVRTLLDHAREHLPALQPCSVRELVADAVETVTKQDAVHVSNLVPDTLPQIQVDRDQLLQALVHLLRNAVEATPQGGVGRIVVSAWGGGSQPLSIKVSDSGMGISEAVLPKIFQPLFSTKQKGTGLGLAVVATVVRKHGGRINVKSAVGKGSDFVIELPASKASTQAA